MSLFHRLHEEKERVFEVGKRNEKKFGNNEIKNSKYTPYTFIICILFSQFRFFMNIYFILIGALQLIPGLSPVNAWSTWLPILFIFTVALIREGYDEVKSFIFDSKINGKPYEGIINGLRKMVKSKDLSVGDYIILRSDDIVPCDVLVAYTSNENGLIYINTSLLDGESTLKQRYSIQITQELGELNISDFFGEVHCSVPNSAVFEFNGMIETYEKAQPLNADNFIPSGSQLKNTDIMLGIVVYTGQQTKISLSSIQPQSKSTKIERFLNKISFGVFISQIVVTLLVGTASNIWQLKNYKSIPYLEITEYKALDWLILYVRYFLLTTTMIPISLKVTLDVCKVIYKMFIERDPLLQNTSVINSSVLEDLGAVEFVFADKTGTITKNKLEFVQIGVNGKIYDLKKDNSDLMKDISNQREDLMELIYDLCLCNSLSISDDSAFGPFREEIAFIDRLRKIGFEITQKLHIGRSTFVTVGCSSLKVPPKTFEVIHKFNFSHERKCMSVIVRDCETKAITLRTKGAGEKISHLAAESYEGFNNQMGMMAYSGLRVMGVGDRSLSEEQLRSITAYLDTASALTNAGDNENALKMLYEQFEKDFTVRGLAAIEDRLQPGVGDTITMLRDAGVSVWMVTGDVIATAIKTAHSCRLFSGDHPTIILTNSCEQDFAKTIDAILDYIKEHRKYYLALSCDSEAIPLEDLLSDSRFLDVACGAIAVVAARATPGQKKDIVLAVKKHGKMTLAIGDGGNDVSMIREADVGLGVVGNEGTQAAAAADFRVGQFGHLSRLLLIHGRYAYYRTSWLSQFCFYKSTVLCLIQISYMFLSGFSGQSFFSSFNLMMYNAVYTFFPVIFFVQDKDIEESSVFLHPSVYSDTQRSIFLNKRTVFWWYIRGIYQAGMCFIGWFFVFTPHFNDPADGSAPSLDEAQQVVYSALIWVVLITVTFDTQHFTALSLIFIWGSWVVYFVIGIIASSIPTIDLIKDEYLVMYRIASNVTSLTVVLTIVSMCIAPPFFIKSLVAKLKPTRTQAIRTMECSRQSEYQPIYLVRHPSDREHILDSPEESVWEKTDSICFCIC